MLHTKFRGNRTTGTRYFLGFFTIYGHGGHLCHVTSIISTHFHFHFLVPESLHKKLVQNGPVVFEKSLF